MFYMTEYYEKLWEKYYLLPHDKVYFRIYCVIVGVVVIALMPKYPEYWPAYVLILFFLMYLMKNKTRNYFTKAFIHRYSDYENCDDPKLKCQYVLVNTFTDNFLLLGVLLLIPFVVLMCGTAFLLQNSEAISSALLAHQYYPNNLTLNLIFIGSNVLVTVGTCIFWYEKITTGLVKMQKQIEAGHYGFFEERDVRRRFGRRRNPN